MNEMQYEDGHYWVQLQSDSTPAVALHDLGVWRLPGVEEEHRTDDFFCIGRAVDLPADAFAGVPHNDAHIPPIRQ